MKGNTVHLVGCGPSQVFRSMRDLERCNIRSEDGRSYTLTATAMSPGGITGWFARTSIPTHSGAYHGGCISILSDRCDSKGVQRPGSALWHRRKAKIRESSERNGLHARELPQQLVPTSHPHARRLPQELFELIIAHILPDTPTLVACSTTCRSLYIAALPHLHRTVTLWGQASDSTRRGLIPLQELGRMRLLPFVKRLRILQRYGYADPWFLPTIFNAQSLFYFSAFTNVQELVVDELDLRAFIPQAQLYFGQFTPTLRSLTLRTPKSDRRQLLYFLGLFPNLDDLKLIYTHTWTFIPDPAPAPQSPRDQHSEPADHSHLPAFLLRPIRARV